MIKVLSIAGSDPSSGAGIQADIKTFQALGVFGMAIPASLTVQNSRGVLSTAPVPHRLLSRQVEALVRDVPPDSIKTGMLLTARNVRAVADSIAGSGITNLVVDPVLRSSSGMMLLEPAGVNAIKKKLFPLARVIMPNIPEAEALTGRRIRSERDIDEAGFRLLETGPSYVLIKGGHRDGAATDMLYGARTTLRFSTTRKKGEFHGTGCMLSAAVSVFIAKGYAVEKAVEKAKQFVDKMLKTAKPVGRSSTGYFQF